MYGIVTLVEGEAGERIRALWAELAASYGKGAVQGHNRPHLTYHAADDYDKKRVRALLERLAAATPAFAVPTVGLGYLHGANGIAFINAVRTPRLSQLHEALWPEATAGGQGVVGYYQTERWFPHVTLGDQPALLEALPRHAGVLGEAVLRVEMAIDNLALIEETAEGHDLEFRVSLRGG